MVVELLLSLLLLVLVLLDFESVPELDVKTPAFDCEYENALLLFECCRVFVVVALRLLLELLLLLFA